MCVREEPGSRSGRSRRELFELIPDPWRGWIGLRKSRRWLRAVRFARRHNSRLPIDAPGVSFYPMRLEPTAGLAHVLRRLEARVVPFGAPAALVVAWHTGTWTSPKDTSRLPSNALNRRCVDVSKGTVDRLWADAAGYSITVDPLTWRGPLVEKPLANAVRGGRVLEGPLTQRRDDVVYQLLVDSRTGDRIHSTRAVILNGRVIQACEKWRPHPHWFAGPEVTVPTLPTDLYSAVECAQLARFADLIGMDYGELDVLRANDSGLIYVVDANRTPVRPAGLAPEHDEAWFGPIAQAFAELIVRA
jgi:hypothetical protein